MGRSAGFGGVGKRLPDCVVTACNNSEDLAFLLETTDGLERALLEQQARADQSQQQTAAAAQQAQRWAEAAQGKVPQLSWTRRLWRPVAFDGRERSFKFQFVAYCGAIDSRLKDLLVLGETKDVAAMRNTDMDPDTRALGAQLYSCRSWFSKLVLRSCWSTQVTLRAETHGDDSWTGTNQGVQSGSHCQCYRWPRTARGKRLNPPEHSRMQTGASSSRLSRVICHFFFRIVLLSSPIFVGGAAFPPFFLLVLVSSSLLVRGAAFHLLLFPFGWCCLIPLAGAVPFTLVGGAAFSQATSCSMFGFLVKAPRQVFTCSDDRVPE